MTYQVFVLSGRNNKTCDSVGKVTVSWRQTSWSCADGSWPQKWSRFFRWAGVQVLKGAKKWLCAEQLECKDRKFVPIDGTEPITCFLPQMTGVTWALLHKTPPAPRSKRKNLFKRSHFKKNGCLKDTVLKTCLFQAITVRFCFRTWTLVSPPRWQPGPSAFKREDLAAKELMVSNKRGEMPFNRKAKAFVRQRPKMLNYVRSTMLESVFRLTTLYLLTSICLSALLSWRRI